MKTSRRKTVLFTILIVLGTTLALEPSWGRPEAPPEAPPQESAPSARPAGTAPPVQWLDWTASVFERARTEDRGVMLTLVSASCGPCVEADRAIWSDAGVRELISRHWIPVRVDLDERPDIDSRYEMVATAFSMGRGVLPVMAFLFPTGEAMWADYSVPLEDQEGRPGIRTLLGKMAGFWRNRFEEARKNAMFVDQVFREEGKQRRPVAPGADVMSAIMDSVVARVDRTHGGYGSPPRVANPHAAQLVLLAAHRRNDPGLRTQAHSALLAAVRGGLHDPIEGGFHQGIRDANWVLPSFGKLLAGNAVYLRALVEAVRSGSDPELSAAAGSTVDYILRKLEAPEGGFYSGQAASNDPEDATAYYTWRVEEFRSTVGSEDLAWAKVLFGFKEEGEVTLGLPPRVLAWIATSIEEAARSTGKDLEMMRKTRDRILGKLADARSKRSEPPVLKARYLDSTALACSALIHASEVLGRRDALTAALKALDAILASNRSLEKGVPHRLDPPGSAGSPTLMRDQAYLGLALLDSAEITGEPRYLDASIAIGRMIQSSYLDAEAGGFYDIVAHDEPVGYLKFRRKILFDSTTPSPQSSAIVLLDALADRTGDETLRKGVVPTIEYATSRLGSLDERCSTMGLALDAHVERPVKITIKGSGDLANELAEASWRLYEPGRIIVRQPGSAGDRASASVCLGAVCRDGVSEPSGIAGTISELKSHAIRSGGSVAAP